MKMSVCKSYDDLPLFLNANLVAQVLGLSSETISIYGYLLSRENRETYQCLVSYRMISEAIGKSVTTVRKYVAELEERSLIRTEHTPVLAARRTVKTKWYIINRYNESHDDTIDESAVMLFLCDEQRGGLTEEQRAFAKEK